MKLTKVEIIEAQKKQLENKSEKVDTQQCPLCGFETDYEFINVKIPKYEEIKDIIITSTPNYGHEQLIKRNYYCPVCNSTPDSRIIMEIINFLDKNQTILLTNNPDKPLKEALKEYKIHYQTSNNLNEIADNSIDTIISIDYLNKIENYQSIIDEYKRILKIKGQLILKINYDENLKSSFTDEAINTSNLRRIFYGDPDDLRVFGNDLKKYIYQKQLTFTKTKLKEISRINCATDSETIIYICTRTM